MICLAKNQETPVDFCLPINRNKQEDCIWSDTSSNGGVMNLLDPL